MARMKDTLLSEGTNFYGSLGCVDTDPPELGEVFLTKGGVETVCVGVSTICSTTLSSHGELDLDIHRVYTFSGANDGSLFSFEVAKENIPYTLTRKKSQAMDWSVKYGNLSFYEFIGGKTYKLRT